MSPLFALEIFAFESKSTTKHLRVSQRLTVDSHSGVQNNQDEYQTAKLDAAMVSVLTPAP